MLNSEYILKEHTLLLVQWHRTCHANRCIEFPSALSPKNFFELPLFKTFDKNSGLVIFSEANSDTFTVGTNLFNLTDQNFVSF